MSKVKRTLDLPIEAGVYTEQTARGATGRWKDADKVRFRYGLPEKMGGWSQVVTSEMIGLARKIWDWASLDSKLWVALGTESKLYLWQGGFLYDMTPIRRVITLVDPFDTDSGSPIVNVFDTSHGAQEGDYVIYTSGNPVGGLDLNGEFRVEEVIDFENYTIDAGSDAGSTASGGGTVQTEYQISVGLSTSAFGLGYGTGPYDGEGYNTPRTVSSAILALRIWSLDNWGEDLLSVPRGGAIYWWDRGSGTGSRAALLPNAPRNVNYMIISQRDRHVFALGCTDLFTNKFDPLLIRWCSKEDFGDWEPTSVNTAGDLRLYRGSKIQAAVRTRGEILVFTDVSVHQINYLGGFAVYGLQTVGENVSIQSPNAAIEVDYRVYFMAEGDFYIHDGVLRVLPCDVRNFVYENLNPAQRDKIHAGLNREFNEVWWFYPGKDGDVWVETDFTTSAQTGDYAVQTWVGGVKYIVGFNAMGWTEITTDATTNYDLVWLRQNTATIETPLDMDLEVTFKINTGIFSRWIGALINTIDLSGSEDTSGDNVEGLTIALNKSLNFCRLYQRLNGSDSQLANGGVGIDLSTLTTPVTLADDVEYGLTITRTADRLKATLYDPVTDTKQTVQDILLSASEITRYTAAGYGVNLGVKGVVTDYSGVMELIGLRAAPANVLTAQSGTGVSTEVNRYVIYNYEEETWTIGALVRTAWHDRSPIFNKPYASGADSFLHIHETGTDDDGTAMVAFIESYDMEIPEAGEDLMHVDQLIPDFVTLAGSVDITLKGKKYPAADYVVKGPYTTTSETNKHSTRIRARQIAIRLESNQLGDKWRMGTMRARARPHGKRA